MKKFWSFCALFPDLFPSSPVPTSEYQLMMFVSWLAQSLSPASVEVYLAAVRSYHIYWVTATQGKINRDSAELQLIIVLGSILTI